MIASGQNTSSTSRIWKGKRVLITGHTGFKGSWLCHWLDVLGAEVYGLALEPESNPNMFSLSSVEDILGSRHEIADIREPKKISRLIGDIKPDVVFHLAAQAIVRRSYKDPVGTFVTNAMGTLNVLEAVRQCQHLVTFINVTSDKCYDNSSLGKPFKEDDPLGGADPYSSSKACAELIAKAYDQSFFKETNVLMASVRAGNVIGGGDWAEDRLIPDIVRAIRKKQTVEIRNPSATRPWQHVLEPLSGYIKLAESLISDGRQFGGSWNFGPMASNNVTVRELLECVGSITGHKGWKMQSGKQPQEAQLLHLDISKAEKQLNWRPRWDLAQTLEMTFGWYDAAAEHQDMKAYTRSQIEAYSAAEPAK